MPMTYRDIFKWGDRSIEEPIDEELLAILKERIDFELKEINDRPGNNVIEEKITPQLTDEQLSLLKQIVGPENVSTNTEDILGHAFGKSYTDALKIREGIFENLPDAVVYPETEGHVKQIVEYCHSNSIAIVPLGGMSSVTEGIAYPNGGIALDLTRHMNEVIEINEIDSTTTVQPGIFGPELEQQLNKYQPGGLEGFTCGHFPQSFEYSTVGGWVATRGAGQESTGYGKIEDLVLGMKIITPTGSLTLPSYPAKAIGPDLIQLMVGSEGSFGIITEITLKVRRLQSTNRYGAFLLKTWNDGIRAVREVMQQRSGKPFLFRLSDPEETDIYLKMSGFGGWKEWIIDKLGYKEGKRVLLLVSTSGNKSYAKTVMKHVKRVVKNNNGRYVGSSPVDEWLEDRYHTPYLRDPMMDHQLIIDTLETATTWRNLNSIWKNVRQIIKDYGKVICMTHLSHMYENGTNLYFTFITHLDKKNPVTSYQDFQQQIIKGIKKNGGSLSHHHGIGRLFGPWMDEEIGEKGMQILQSIKKEVDPNNIMNPGGTLGLE